MKISQISVFLENKPGGLYHLSEVLAKNNIDMRALSLAEAAEFGIARIIVDDVYKTTTTLKDEGFVHNVTPVLGVPIPHEPGGLHKVLQVLNEAAINVEYMYAFVGNNDKEIAYMIFRVQDNKAAVAALAAKGICCVDQEQLAQL